MQESDLDYKIRKTFLETWTCRQINERARVSDNSTSRKVNERVGVSDKWKKWHKAENTFEQWKIGKAAASKYNNGKYDK